MFMNDRYIVQQNSYTDIIYISWGQEKCLTLTVTPRHGNPLLAEPLDPVIALNYFHMQMSGSKLKLL